MVDDVTTEDANHKCLQYLHSFTSSTNIPKKEVLAGFADEGRTYEAEETNHALYGYQLKTMRFTKTNDFKGVPHPLSGDYTPKPQKEFDDSLYVYGKKGPQKPEISVSDDNSSEHSTCQSNDSEGSCGNTSKHSFETESESLNEPNEMFKSKLEVTNEKDVSAPKSKEVAPSCVSHIKTPRQPLKDKETHKVNRKNWNDMMERELGEGYSFTKKKCFVCGSLSHLIKDCDYYEKKMAREAEVKRPKVNAVSPKVNTVRSRQPVPHKTSNSVSPKRPQMNQINQRRDFSKSYSSVRRPFAKTTTQMAHSNAVMGSWGSAVKTSASYNWRNSRPNFNYNSGPTFIRTEHPLLLELLKAKGPQRRPSLCLMKSDTLKGLVTTYVQFDMKGTPNAKDTLSVLGKFDGKSDEGFLVGYSLNSKAYRVYNLVTKRVEVNLHVNFLEDKPNVKGVGNHATNMQRNMKKKCIKEIFKISKKDEILTRTSTREEEQVQNNSRALASFSHYLKAAKKQSQSSTQWFVVFLSQEEPKKITEALQDDSWVQAMQEELLQFKLQQVWVLVDLPHGIKVIGTKWVYRNKRDERGVIGGISKDLVVGGSRVSHRECQTEQREDLHSQDLYCSLDTKKFDLVLSMKVSLMYLTASRPDIMYCSMCLFTVFQTATTNTNADGTLEINATIDTIGYSITEASIRNTLQLGDATGITMLPNDEIFEGMGQMGSRTDDVFGSISTSSSHFQSHLLITTVQSQPTAIHTYTSTPDPYLHLHLFLKLNLHHVEPPLRSHLCPPNPLLTHKNRPWKYDFKESKRSWRVLKRRNVVLSDSEEEEPEAQGRKSQDDPLASLVQGLVTPSTTKPKSRKKAPMSLKETPKKSKEQILQEEASLAEAIRLDSLQKEEEAKQIHLDSLLA
ncbi:retrovirus-related pol polyprotein from transposon TNT 1-94 [Tanacetum coccineum]